MSKSKDEPMSNEMFSPLPASVWDAATTSMDHWAICGICGEHIPEGMPRLVAPSGAECHRSCYLSARSSERVDEERAKLPLLHEVGGALIDVSALICVGDLIGPELIGTLVAVGPRFQIYFRGGATSCVVVNDIPTAKLERENLIAAWRRFRGETP